MAVEEEHNLADFSLLLPAFLDPFQPARPDASDVQQHLRMLTEDVEGALFVDGDDPGAELRPDAANGAGGQVSQDAVRGGRMGRVHILGLKLGPVGFVDDPAAGGFEMFASRGRVHDADDGCQFLPPPDFHLQHREPVLGVVVGDSLDLASQRFGHRPACGTRGVPESPAVGVAFRPPVAALAIQP